MDNHYTKEEQDKEKIDKINEIKLTIIFSFLIFLLKNINLNINLEVYLIKDIISKNL